ncbi:Other ulk ulk protein kinase [Mycena indigotica]|uniref:non-specific serine/threonine protein kinase n=1 Tax=Mycena indigotica TaxID=2126181 RepID=A0A8H6S6G5_9AGAR|nr:Other ulk ulk protein kinase [Mycena indigotica]KAF7293085.1 Other ulk ulk protein kinase [Mycena indigotica]
MPAPATTSGRSSTTSSNHPGRSEEDEELRPYVIGSHIGKGSFATVYKGYNEEDHKTVAIKTVLRSKLSPKLFENLQSEIQILKSLSHRHITKLIDIVRTERNIYLIMEYCAGGDLTNYIKTRGKVESLKYAPSPGAALQWYPHPKSGGLDEIVVRSFLRQLARALKFLRIRHLNLLLNPAPPEELARGHPIGVPILKVADFGFARSLPNAMMAETLCGSPLYMAPEILRYQKYDAKADLWSVGAVLYEMAVGRPPFRAGNHIELLKKIEQSKAIRFPDEDPKVIAKNPNEPPPVVPDDIKRLIKMLLKQLPAERADFQQFFGSMALAKSKFPRPEPDAEDDDNAPAGGIPAHHLIIPPEVLDPKAMIPPSKFHFRERGENGEPRIPATAGLPSSPISTSPRDRAPISDKTRRPSFPQSSKPLRVLSTEASIIPGETEEDGKLRREYVLVDDTQAVEFNRAVDELNTAPRRPLLDRRIPQTPATEDPPESPTSFPPAPHAYPVIPPPPLSSSPSSIASRAAANALNRALSIASKKLFGANPAHRRSTSSLASNVGDRESAPPSPRRPHIITLDNEGERDPLEDELLASLEILAQKTFVLTNWADEMYEYVKAVPQKPLPDPNKFEKREGEGDKNARRRKHADMEAEYNAVTCVAVYMLLMSFAQKGIDQLARHQEHMRMRHPDGDFIVSEGFDDALSWFTDQFQKCYDRATLVKTWLPATYDGAKSWLDQLVYDRALVLSRSAARKELFNQATSPDECEKLYEESLWCLYALQDDLLQTGNPFMDEDRTTIDTWIKRTKLRLHRCRVRMAMTDKERLNDVRADNNLADIARIPAPWDAKPTDAVVPPPLS